MSSEVVVSESANPAPGDLEIVRRFVNTIDVDEPHPETLDSAKALTGWLAAAGLTAPRVTAGPADLRRAREVRDALRQLLLANNGQPLDDGALETLNRAAARA